MRFVPTLLVTLAFASPGVAADWPQLLGPNRDGVATDEKLLEEWPKSGPDVVWQREVGAGYSGIVVAKGRAFLFHRVDDELVVDAVEATSGKPIWQRRFETRFRTGFVDDDGPRATPVVTGNSLLLYGPQGRLWSLAADTGKTNWLRNTHEDFGAPEGYFGAGSTPLVEGDRVLVNVGSRNGAGIVGFDLATGKTAWLATDEYASYSSPVGVTIDGTRHAIFATRLKCVSLDPKTGKVRFEFPFGERGPTVNAASPLVVGDHLFLSAHYGVGAVWGTIGKAAFDESWRSDRVLSAHYTSPIEADGKIYGIDGQERVGPGELRCIDPDEKTVLWSRPDFGYGQLLRAGDKFLAVQNSGDLVLFDANTKKYDERARARVLGQNSRVPPALANGLLYVRDRRTAKCIRVGTAS